MQDLPRGVSVCGCGCASAFHFYWRCFTIAKLDHQLNTDIRDAEVRVIGSDGTMLGIMSSEQALALAEEQDLDLVKISPTANPPVCKIMDYGKFRFDQLKKEKEARKNQRVVEIKEIRMSPGIDTNDFNVKLRNALKFLREGNRVKVTVRRQAYEHFPVAQKGKVTLSSAIIRKEYQHAETEDPQWRQEEIQPHQDR